MSYKINGRRVIKAPPGFTHVINSMPHKGMAYEYIVVAAQKLGRDIKPEEVVHHLDLNPDNNDPDNLLVFASVKDHSMFHQRNCDLSILEKTVDGAYRIKTDVANEPKHRCKKCGAPVTDCTTQLCLDCFNKSKQIALGAISKAAGVVIDRDTLAELVRTKPATAVARYY